MLIQTRNPDDPVMKALADGDRDAFYAREAKHAGERARAAFRASGGLILSGADGEAVREAGRALARAHPPARGVTIWGPTPAFYQVLRGRTRERLLLQADRAVDVQAYLRSWLERVKLPNTVRLAVDVDPVSFF